MKIKAFPLGPIGTNCYILSKQNKCVIVDPGGEPEKIKRYIEESSITPLAILLTHAHFDHIGAVDSLRKEYHMEVYIHENEKEWLERPELNRSILFFGESGAIKTNKPENLLQIGTLSIPPFHCEVVYTPGHSPGSVTFIFHEEQFIISGDVLFQQSIGRTDLPEGDHHQLMRSISEQLYTLPDDFTVYPGHGPATQIGLEKRTNPFTLAYFKS